MEIESDEVLHSPLDEGFCHRGDLWGDVLPRPFRFGGRASNDSDFVYWLLHRILGIKMAENENMVDSPETSIEMRILIIENELRSIKEAISSFPTALEKEKADIRKSLETLEVLKRGLQDVSSTAEESSKVVNHLEKRVEVVKKDATSGFVISTIIFSILMLISLFARS